MKKKEILNSVLWILFFTVAFFVSYFFGYYHGTRDVKSEYAQTLDSLKKDNDLWWVKLNDLKADLRTFQDAEEFKNHSEIK